MEHLYFCMKPRKFQLDAIKAGCAIHGLSYFQLLKEAGLTTIETFADAVTILRIIRDINYEKIIPAEITRNHGKVNKCAIV
jgi:hypothetical protein